MKHSNSAESVETGGAKELVELDRDHPGFRDAAYRERRNRIAEIAMNHCETDSVPTVTYTPDEQEVWREVWSHLAPLLNQHACASYLESLAKVSLNQTEIPQLEDVNRQLEAFGGFKMTPVAGLVKADQFLTCLERGIFLSTQYIRHPSAPLYTPEPDVVHELVGHAAFFADPRMVKLNRAFGKACRRAPSESVTLQLIRVYWYTLEFGLTYENGDLKAYGAGILSSYGELGRAMSHDDIRPFSVEEVGRTPFDPTDYQNILFSVPSLEMLEETLLDWFSRL
jgi:phenylalanine-4-hydroxylase